MRKLFFLLILSFSFNSCVVFNSGNVSSGPLLHVTDKYIDIASGTSKATSYFWIAGVYSDRLILEAKAELFKSRPLKDNEYYANFACDISKTVVLGLFYTTRVTVSAEVLKVSDPEQGQSVSNESAGGLKSNGKSFNDATGLHGLKPFFKNRVDSFFIGDIIYYRSPILPDFHSYEILSIYGRDVCLKPVYGTAPNITISQEDVVFSTKKSLDGFSVGEKVNALVGLGRYQAIIVACSHNKVLLKVVADQTFTKVSTSKLEKIK